MAARRSKALAATLAGVFGLAALSASLVLAVPRLLGAAAGPEAAILSQLKLAETEGLTLQVPGAAAPLISHRVRVGPTTVHLEGRGAVAVVLLDFSGRLGETNVSSLGYERIPFAWQDGRWVPTDGSAPRLVAAVAVLEARRQALERGEAEALEALRSPGRGPGPELGLERLLRVEERRYGVEAWLLRSERAHVTVAERFRLTGRLPEGPVEERGLRNLTLGLEGEKLYFSAGLM